MRLALTRCSVNIWCSEGYKQGRIKYLHPEELIIYSGRLNTLMWNKIAKEESCSVTKWMQSSREDVSVSVWICAPFVLGWDRREAQGSGLKSKGWVGDWRQWWKPRMSPLLSASMAAANVTARGCASGVGTPRATELLTGHLQGALQAGLGRGEPVWAMGTWALESAGLSLNPSLTLLWPCDFHFVPQFPHL